MPGFFDHPNPDTALKSSNTFTHHRIILFPAVLLYCPWVCRLQACTYPQNSISLLNLHGRCLLTNARFDLKLIIHWFGVALFLWSWEQPISMVFQLISSLEESGLRVKGLVDLFWNERRIKPAAEPTTYELLRDKGCCDLESKHCLNRHCNNK